jgi:hypothetical protein
MKWKHGNNMQKLDLKKEELLKKVLEGLISSCLQLEDQYKINTIFMEI